MMAIEAAIRRFDGNVTQAARRLDIAPSTIYRKQKAWEEAGGQLPMAKDHKRHA